MFQHITKYTQSKYSAGLIAGVVLLLTLLFVSPVYAQSPPRIPDFFEDIVRFVNLGYAFGGIVFVGIGIFIGIQWMSSQGEAEKVQEISGKITLWIIGFLLFFLSGVIVLTIYDLFGVYECGDPARGPVRPGFSYFFTQC